MDKYTYCFGCDGEFEALTQLKVSKMQQDGGKSQGINMNRILLKYMAIIRKSKDMIILYMQTHAEEN